MEPIYGLIPFLFSGSAFAPLRQLPLAVLLWRYWTEPLQSFPKARRTGNDSEAVKLEKPLCKSAGCPSKKLPPIWATMATRSANGSSASECPPTKMVAFGNSSPLRSISGSKADSQQETPGGCRTSRQKKANREQPDPLKSRNPLGMEIIDNINRLLGDDLKNVLKPGSKLKVAASCFYDRPRSHAT